MDEETTVGRWYKGKWKERWFVQTWWSQGLVFLQVSATSLSKLASFFIHFPPQYFPKPHPTTSAKLNKIWGENPFQLLFQSPVIPGSDWYALERWVLWRDGWSTQCPLPFPQQGKKGISITLWTCKGFLISLIKCIEMQCILALCYLFTPFRRKLNLNAHNKILYKNTNWSKGWQYFWQRSVY